MLPSRALTQQAGPSTLRGGRGACACHPAVLGGAGLLPMRRRLPPAHRARSTSSSGGEDGVEKSIAVAAEEKEEAAKSSSKAEVEEDEKDFFGSEELVQELKTGFGQRGEVYFIAQAVAIVLIVLCPFQLAGLLDLAATLLLTTGLVFIAYALFSLGRNLSPMPQPRKRHSLITSGMYSYVRHPMYAGVLMATLGLAAISRNETRLALVCALWWILEKKVAAEEEALSSRYPEEYATYKEKVRKFVPFVY